MIVPVVGGILPAQASWCCNSRNIHPTLKRDNTVSNYAANVALKILGAYGYSTEFPVERYYRDAKSYQIVEGSSNVQKMIIAQDALGYRKANR
jgi:acyl-CoA dehydrogenase-like protein